jgi:formamidopyrimidine-DNA glycosylase
VVVELNSGDGIVFEPRMTGLVLLAQPPDQGHLRLRIAVKIDESHSPAELLYWDRRGLGSVRLFSPAELERKLGIKNLGPDALAISCGTLRQRLGRSRRAIKVALLDQHAVAGIGNLYSAEILHLARIHPLRRCCDLRPKQWRDLHAAMRRVLHAAIQAEGSTLSDGTYRNALNQAGQYQNHHRVYDQAGEKCGRCGRGTILRIVQAQRATFFCPVCQRLTAARR